MHIHAQKDSTDALLKAGRLIELFILLLFVFFFGKVMHLIPLSDKFALKWVTERREVELSQTIYCHFVHPCYPSFARPFCFTKWRGYFLGFLWYLYFFHVAVLWILLLIRYVIYISLYVYIGFYVYNCLNSLFILSLVAPSYCQ